jgi:putative ABC transport system permease protein
MFKSYVKTAWRFLLKNRTFSFINIFGLAIGTLCCLYIVVYVQDQYSYDKHHKDATDIYRITADLKLTGDLHHNATCSPPIAPAMKRDFSEVAQFTRVVPTLGADNHLLNYREKAIYEKEVVYVDSTFFDIFSYHFVDGSPSRALEAPFSIVLMRPIADKLFGREDPVGKTIMIDDGYGKNNFKVTAVIDESLGKSTIKANLFITMHSGGIGDYVLQNTIWGGNNFTNSYVKLQPGASSAALEKKLPAFLNKYGEQQFKTLGMQKQLHLQPVTDIHTTPGYEVEASKTVSPSFLYLLILIAVLIQVIACINFMNLSTARAAKRAKEVGVRKVIGAQRKDLMGQFLAESFMLSFLSILVALPLLWFALPFLNQITGGTIHASLFADYRLWFLLGGISLLTGLVAGSYPAFYLSAFQAMKVIKGDFTSHISATGIRRSLVVFQFVLSIVLISGIIVIYSQLHYINNRDLGFAKDQRLIFSFYTNDVQNKVPVFMSDLRQLAGVVTVSQADNYLSQNLLRDHGVYLAGGNMTTSINTQNIDVDEYFVRTNGIRLVSGRDFRRTDSGKVLINEALARRLGLKPETAPGTRLYEHYEPNPETYVEVAGVMKDFNYISLRSEVKPFMLVYDSHNEDMPYVVVATNTTDYQTLLGRMGAIWNKDFPGTPFEYNFLDAQVQKQYESEITFGRIINSFTLVAILISCLGLFGLAAFSAEQRIKEIGIRKVLGAGVPGIVRLLSRDFLRLVLVSIVIATPIAWWVMDKWLQSFVYRVPLSWWMFALAGLLAVLIALFTVSFQAIKAAVANPVKSLRAD